MKNLKDLIDALEKYPIKGSFRFGTNDVLSKICNIPVRNDYSGIYLFYDDKGKLIYVGISGRERPNGQIIHRKDGLRGRLLTGKQFGDKRSKAIPIRMKKESIEFIKIKWFVTHGDSAIDVPRHLEKQIILAHKKEKDGKRPKWNRID